jgi:hypothetical protein
LTLLTILFLRHVSGIHFAASCWLTILALVCDELVLGGLA